MFREITRKIQGPEEIKECICIEESAWIPELEYSLFLLQAWWQWAKLFNFLESLLAQSLGKKDNIYLMR